MDERLHQGLLSQTSSVIPSNEKVHLERNKGWKKEENVSTETGGSRIITALRPEKEEEVKEKREAVIEA